MNCKKELPVTLALIAGVVGICAVSQPAFAQQQAKAYLLLIMDTSGSMGWDNPPRIFAAKGALADAVNASGEVIWGLQRFGQTCAGSADCSPFNLPGLCNGTCNGEQPIVPLDPDRQEDILAWVDDVCDFTGAPPVNPELLPDGPTPLGESLNEAFIYFTTSVIPTDPYWGCRPYYVVLLTDGQETCGGDPVAAAASLDASGIRTLVIGFGVAQPNAQLDAIATAGGTGPSAVYVQVDEASLSLALMNIITDSVLVEVCNGMDDDCNCPGDTNGDGQVCTCNPAANPICDDGVDEGFLLGQTCDNGMMGLCYLEGETVCRLDGLGVECDATDVLAPELPDEWTCDGLDNDCDCLGDTNNDGCVCCVGDWNVDEGLLNACGTCDPTVPAEVCDWIDNDCNGIVDDVPTIGASCTYAYPNTPPFSGDEGECELGEVRCNYLTGELDCFGYVGPVDELCDCLDNDCDGQTDEPPTPPDEPPLCPPESTCIDCWCVSPCGTGEFPCPPGYQCDASNNCVPDECTRAQCPPGFYCALAEFCQAAACTGDPNCDGTCAATEYCLLADGTCQEKPCLDLCARCDPGTQVCVDGICYDDDCHNFPEQCVPGEICHDHACVADPCTGAGCSDSEFCRLGECVPSCAYVNCAKGELCRDGQCYDHACAGVQCPDGQVCDVNGGCIDDPCLSVDCGAGFICHCGPGECADGVAPECEEDLCRYMYCPRGSVCVAGECVAPTERNWVLFGGGGGCACRAAGSGPTRDSAPMWPFVLVVFGLGGVLLRRRRSAGRTERRRSRPAAGVAAAFFLAAAVLMSTACKVDPECVDCRDCHPTVAEGDPEPCDWIDNDCDCPGDTNGDGQWCTCNLLADPMCDEGVDEDTDTDTDVLNCGVCGKVCVIENAVPACVNGECRIESCLPGFHDNNGDVEDGCEYYCLPTNGGTETCDGLDNDCDCAGDTNDDGCYCCIGDDGVDDEDDLLAAGEVGIMCGIDTGECATGLSGCVDGFLECVGEVVPTAELCDDLDNDCDGATDEIFPTKGNPCFTGTGVCYLEGAFTCNATGDDVWCGCTTIIATVCDNLGDEMPPDGDTTQVATEVWNNLDDDCNGQPDDGIPIVENLTHISYVHPTFGAMDFWIYTHEASRPDASASDAGVVETKPQSVPGVLPWALVTSQGAAAVCTAAGRRLCNEDEWQAACESGDATGVYTWPYGNTYVQDHCNDNPYDSDPMTVEDDDALLTTGAMSSCVTPEGLFDMSGNLKEWVTLVPPDPNIWGIRGGGFDSPANGTQCTFDFAVGDATYVFTNLGFRCCSDDATPTPP